MKIGRWSLIVLASFAFPEWFLGPMAVSQAAPAGRTVSAEHFERDGMWHYRLVAGTSNSPAPTVIWQRQFRNRERNTRPSSVPRKPYGADAETGIGILGWYWNAEGGEIAVVYVNRNAVYGDINRIGRGGMGDNTNRPHMMTPADRLGIDARDPRKPPLTAKVNPTSRGGDYRVTLMWDYSNSTNFVFNGFRWVSEREIEETRARTRRDKDGKEEVVVDEVRKGTNTYLFSYIRLSSDEGWRSATNAYAGTGLSPDYPFDRRYRLTSLADGQSAGEIVWEKDMACETSPVGESVETHPRLVSFFGESEVGRPIVVYSAETAIIVDGPGPRRVPGETERGRPALGVVSDTYSGFDKNLRVEIVRGSTPGSLVATLSLPGRGKKTAVFDGKVWKPASIEF